MVWDVVGGGDDSLVSGKKQKENQAHDSNKESPAKTTVPELPDQQGSYMVDLTRKQVTASKKVAFNIPPPASKDAASRLQSDSEKMPLHERIRHLHQPKDQLLTHLELTQIRRVGAPARLV